MMRLRTLKSLSAIPVMTALAVLLTSGFVAFKLYSAHKKASLMMIQLAKLQVGITEQHQALEIMKPFNSESKDSSNCLGGPCLDGKIYEVRRSKLLFSDWWPETGLRVGLYFSRGVLVIKHLGYRQEQPGNPEIDIFEDEYPFPERHWDVDIPSGFRDDGSTIYVDQRASKAKIQQIYNLNLKCFLYLHGCQCGARLQKDSVQCGEMAGGWPSSDH